MEDESVSLINYVPSFARGFNLLLVHDDTLSLMYLSSLLEQYSFNVTATDDTSAAASMICDHEGRFQLIMAKANMPGMDALSFLNVLIEKDIPVIFIYSRGFDDVTRKALATGSCYFLQEPIRSNDLKYVWQHVYHSKVYSAKETQNVNCQDKVCFANGLQHTKIKQVHGSSYGKRSHDDNKSKQKEERAELSSAQMNFNSNYLSIGPAERKRTIIWTPELHLKFTQALRVLGDNYARPKAILCWMNEPYLTVRQVASHLQKYKARLKRIQKACNADLSPVSRSSYFRGKTQFPSPFEMFSLVTKGLPASTASLNDSQNQNQFLMNYAETKESENLKLLEIPGLPASTASLNESQNQNQFLTNHPETQAEFDPGVPASTACLNKSQNQNQFLMNYAETEESYTLQMLETPGNPTLTYEVPTEMTNCGSQSLDSTVGHLVPAALVDQNQPATKYDDLINMFVEDCDSFDWFGNEPNPGDVDQYSEMLRRVLHGDSSSSPGFDINKPNGP